MHMLKIWPEYFRLVRDGDKAFELRKNDRDYNVGDHLVLREWLPDKEEYTGESILVEVTYILYSGPWLEDGYVAMSIKRIA